MHLEDLDVELGSKDFRHARGETGEQVDAETHIAGFDDGSMTGGGNDLGLVRLGQTCRADDMDDASLRRERGEGHGRSRRGEVEHALNAGEHRQGIVGDGHAERLDPGHLANVTADHGRALSFDAAHNHAAGCGGKHAGQRLAHAPCGAKHGDPHVTHCR
jgi:hypothetical protein